MINRATLCGYVADDPMIRATEGSKLARIRVATIEHILIQKSGNVRPHTEWHNVTAWGELADIIDREVRVGAPIYIEGPLRTQEWENKDGKKYRTTEIIANKVELLDEIEGYQLPQSIVERQEELYPKRATTTPPEISAPAEDPDNLPF